MIKLTEYSDQYRNATVERIVHFFGFHNALIHGSPELSNENFRTAEETLEDWLGQDNDFYMIALDGDVIGFLHIGYRGSNVAWIEDIYVDPEYRNQGVATQAIHLAEDIIKKRPDYTAICFDVVPQNEAALRLYYNLGYNNLSLITVRKELYDNKLDRKESVLGLEFNI